MLKQIGKYTISERIGRGTYSRVYRAMDPQGRSVAIKVSTTQTEAQHLDQFQKDLVAAASVLHPSLVAVHDLGFENDCPYLVMELVEGQDLDHLLKSNDAPSLAERIRIMEQVAGALKAAHERGVFHLDVRPTKIMRTDDGTAKLLDLGLGRLSYDPARVTEHGYLVGAPFYMSPERLTAIDTADERCDIWSFGVTFYEWLSGRHPFYDDDGERMIGNIMDETPAELQAVPSALNHLILRAIEKDPNDRYRNFSDLLADLQPMITGLKREESDALMAEALKQTDSGRWHEARRIARKLRESESEQATGSDLFGVSEMDAQDREPAPVPERARPVSAPAAQPVAAAAAAAARASIAVDTPEPAAPAEPALPHYQEETSVPPISTARAPQRPERTPPKIPPMGLRNGGAPKAENGSVASARTERPAVSNGNHHAPAAASAAAATPAPPPSTPPKATVVRETVARERKIDSPTPRPSRSVPSVAPPQNVRILQEEESSGFPWVRIIAFAIPVLLLLGAGYFFLNSNGKGLRASDKVSSTEKRANPAGNDDSSERSPATNITPDDGKTSNTAGDSSTSTALNPNGGAGTTPSSNPTDPANPTQPRAFDAKTLAKNKPQLPGAKQKNNTVLKDVKLPSLPGGADGSEVAAASLGVGVPPPPPPPPAPAAKASQQSSASGPLTPPAAKPQTATETSTQPPASSAGGVYSAPVLIHQVAPIYPPQAMQRKVQGQVRFQVTVTKDGSLKNIQLLNGDPMLNIAARQAVMQFKYRPAMLNGEPVEVTQTIVVRFGLSQ